MTALQETITECRDFQHSSLSQTSAEPLVDVEMGSDSKEKKGKKHKKEKESSKTKQYATDLAHVCVISYVILIIYLCLKYEFVFFTWHPLLLSIGWSCAIIESVLALTKDNHLTRNLSSTIRLRIHWILQVLGLTATLIGCTVVFVNKNRLNKPHFHSWHGFFGLMSTVCLIPANLNGIPTLYKRDLRNYVKPKIVKFTHVVSGSVAFIFGGITLILSVYTKWFGRNTQNNPVVFYCALFCVIYPILFGLMKPVKMCYKIILNKLYP